jgi:hypothetical protein
MELYKKKNEWKKKKHLNRKKYWNRKKYCRGKYKKYDPRCEGTVSGDLALEYAGMYPEVEAYGLNFDADDEDKEPSGDLDFYGDEDEGMELYKEKNERKYKKHLNRKKYWNRKKYCWGKYKKYDRRCEGTVSEDLALEYAGMYPEVEAYGLNFDADDEDKESSGNLDFYGDEDEGMELYKEK